MGSLDASFHVTALSALTIVQNNRNIGMTLSSTASLLLIYLLTTNRLHDREALAELFWPERQAKQAASNLRTLLTEPRRECTQHLVITGRTIAVNSAQITYDVATFNAHITAAPENMVAVHRICHAVGGLPLALEMATYTGIKITLS